MKTKNKYAKRAKISEAKFRQLVKYFEHDLDAKIVSSLLNLNRNTVNRYLWLIRKRIADFCEHQSSLIAEVEVDNSSSGWNQIKERRGCGEYKKTPMFGIFLRGIKVYTKIVSDCAKADLKSIIHVRVDPGKFSHNIGRSGCDAVVDIRLKKHYYIDHGVKQFDSHRNHNSVIDSFLTFARARLNKFHGIADSTSYLHVKECEFRFNYRNQDLTKILLKMFRERPLSMRDP